MPKVEVNVVCSGTIYESWTLSVTDEQAARIAADNLEGLAVLDEEGTEIIDVQTTTDDEHDRELRSVVFESEGA